MSDEKRLKIEPVAMAAFRTQEEAIAWASTWEDSATVRYEPDWGVWVAMIRGLDAELYNLSLDEEWGHG